jgi:hypothetical protein
MLKKYMNARIRVKEGKAAATTTTSAKAFYTHIYF